MSNLRNQKPFKINQIDTTRIIYGEVSGSDNRKSLLLGYNDLNDGEKRLIFQTTELKNINSLIDKDSYYELDIPLYGESDKRVNLLIDFLKNLDTAFVNEARNKHREWFGDVSNIKYKSIIRKNVPESEDPILKNGSIKLKILKNKNSNTRITTNKTKTNIDIHDLTKGSYLKMILECYALWITKEGFGLYLKPILIDQRYSQENQDLSFVNDSEEDENKEVNDIIDTEIISHVKNINIDYETKNTIVSESSDIINSNINDTNIETLPHLNVNNEELSKYQTEYTNTFNNIKSNESNNSNSDEEINNLDDVYLY
tara:strand:- start:29 stop:970 length:942 start_codon:yes stop_codon:yes gene_type:complete